MGAVTVREVLGAVSVLLNDSAPQFKRWPESELVGWLDDAQMAIAKYLPAAASRIDALKLAAGSKQSIEAVPAASLIPGYGTAPAVTFGLEFLGAVRNLGADGLTPGRAITVVDRSLLDAQDVDWHSKPGPVVKHVVHDPRIPRSYLVFPPVAVGSTSWIEVQWVAQPVKVPNTGTPGAELYAMAGANATLLSIPDSHRDDLIHYVCARAHMKHSQAASDQSKAMMFGALFTGSINATVAALTGNNPNMKRLPMAPANLGSAS